MASYAIRNGVRVEMSLAEETVFESERQTIAAAIIEKVRLSVRLRALAKLTDAEFEALILAAGVTAADMRARLIGNG